MRKRLGTMICSMVATTALMTGVFAATAPSAAFAGFHWSKCPPKHAHQKGKC
jgi:hypothetical protein